MAETALEQAQRLQVEAAAEGFDWSELSELWAKLEEEIGELKAAANAAERREELGDLLFMAVNLARHLGVDAEAALTTANSKFCRRYAYVLEGQLPPPGDTGRLTEMERRWQIAKQRERQTAK